MIQGLIDLSEVLSWQSAVGSRKYLFDWRLLTADEKKSCGNAAFFSCAQDKTRTCTPLRAPAPQAGVSTNFTTWAWVCGAQNRTRTCTSLLTLVPETSASTNFAIWATCRKKRSASMCSATLLLSFNAAAKIKIFSLSNTLQMKLAKNNCTLSIRGPAVPRWSPRNT